MLLHEDDNSLYFIVLVVSLLKRRNRHNTYLAQFHVGMVHIFMIPRCARLLLDLPQLRRSGTDWFRLKTVFLFLWPLRSWMKKDQSYNSCLEFFGTIYFSNASQSEWAHWSVRYQSRRVLQFYCANLLFLSTYPRLGVLVLYIHWSART